MSIFRENRCSYPDCKLVAQESWSLIPVCYSHYEAIKKETFQYYERRLPRTERIHYSKIAPMVKGKFKEAKKMLEKGR